jgi:SEC-C motif-containing protein/tetratricopeptide repeat protein
LDSGSNIETELWDAGLEDPQFLTARIMVCEEGLRRFPTDDGLLTENRRRAMAESYFRLGETAKAEALYREWLTADPQWGWGWIGWSDTYRFIHTERQDVARAEQILREGLAIPDVRDRAELLELLADLCDEQGRHAEAKDLWRQAKTAAAAMETTLHVPSSGTVVKQNTTITFGGEGVPLSELPKITGVLRNSAAPVNWQKIGRNDPCPCGSGKKFKKRDTT